MSRLLSEIPALILAGGKGTRLASVLDNCPKILAPLGQATFLEILVAQLRGQGFRRLVLLLGYLSEQVIAAVEVLRQRYPEISFAFSVEPAPMGTAGALALAESFCDQPFFLLNGDTFVEFDAPQMLAQRQAAVATLALSRVDDAARFGTVRFDDGGWVTAFEEKGNTAGTAWINAGVYLMTPQILQRIPRGRPVSLETEVFPALLSERRLRGVPQAGRFIDIGTPESYSEFSTWQRDQE